MIRIDALIEKNDWKELENLLKTQQGAIISGKRYSYDPESMSPGADINVVCERIIEASDSQTFQKMTTKDRMAASSVITELKRLYDESSKALDRSPYVTWMIVQISDFWEGLGGYQSIEKLEILVLSQLQLLISRGK